MRLEGPQPTTASRRPATPPRLCDEWRWRIDRPRSRARRPPSPLSLHRPHASSRVRPVCICRRLESVTCLCERWDRHTYRLHRQWREPTYIQTGNRDKARGRRGLRLGNHITFRSACHLPVGGPLDEHAPDHACATHGIRALSRRGHVRAIPEGGVLDPCVVLRDGTCRCTTRLRCSTRTPLSAPLPGGLALRRFPRRLVAVVCVSRKPVARIELSRGFEQPRPTLGT